MAYGPPTTLDPTNVMGRRIGAWFIDIVIPSAAALFIYWIIFIGGATKYTDAPADFCSSLTFRQPEAVCQTIGNDAFVGTKDDERRSRAVAGLMFLVGAVNLFVVQGITGAAVGKRMLGLRVVKADGSLVRFWANAGRTLMFVVDQVFCPLIGLITAFVTHPHRRVGDFAAGTFVVAKESVGTPIGTQMGQTAYPPPWSPPPAGQGWTPPPAGGQTWGAPTPGAPTPGAPAPTPGWGTPPGASPPATNAPPTWGTPAASPPAATEPPPADAPGWGAPAPASTPQPETQPAPVPEPAAPPAGVPQAAAPAQGRDPQWDAQRNAWVYWEAETSRWLQYDAASGQWGPLR